MAPRFANLLVLLKAVVPPGIELWTQGQRFLTLSPLLYQQKKESFRRKTLS